MQGKFKCIMMHIYLSFLQDDRQPPTTMRTQNFTKNWLPNSAAARNVNIWIGIALLLAIPLFMG